MGSELIKRGVDLPDHIWSAHANINFPNLVKNIHADYIKAGSKIIVANTFRTTPRAFKKTGLSLKSATKQAYESLTQAIQLAKEASNDSITILGSIAPLEDCYKPELFPGKKIAENEFGLIIDWLIDNNVDGIILETMNNIDETETILNILSHHSVPTYVSHYLASSKFLPFTNQINNIITLSKNYDIHALLFNCMPINRMNKIVNHTLNEFQGLWGLYPNLGIGDPAPDGKIINTISNEKFLKLIDKSINKGAQIIGACCGSSPKHIKLLKNIYNAKNY